MSGLHLSRLTLDAIEAEYTRAHVKHSGHTPKSARMSDGERLTILVEEIGEVARAITYDNADLDNLCKELTQVCAMSAGWLEYALGLRDARRNGVGHVHRSIFTMEHFTGPERSAQDASGDSDQETGELGVSVLEP